jgi:hypothetical protein
MKKDTGLLCSHDHMVSVTCKAEKCACGKKASHKISEEIPYDDNSGRHPWTAYVCCKCFALALSKRTCKWEYDLDYDIWDTDCDKTFCFNAEGVEANQFKFCPFCGKIILDSASMLKLQKGM